MTRFRPEAASAALCLDADAVFFNEYFPKSHGAEFAARLADGGLIHQMISPEPSERANRTFVASRLPLDEDRLPAATFDQQLPANTLSVRFADSGLRVLALRVPAYERAQQALTLKSWDWLEASAALLRNSQAVILGDLNVRPAATSGPGIVHFRRIRAAGWQLATSETEASYFSPRGSKSTLDSLLHTASVLVTATRFVSCVAGYSLAGQPDALSDHAAIVADLHVQGTHVAPH
jgi:endonuclease/exonuclease/phosphatase family metal-dependent hydrolase